MNHFSTASERSSGVLPSAIAAKSSGRSHQYATRRVAIYEVLNRSIYAAHAGVPFRVERERSRRRWRRRKMMSHARCGCRDIWHAPGNSVSETGERMKGGAVMDERSPEKDAMLYNAHHEYKLNAK